MGIDYYYLQPRLSGVAVGRQDAFPGPKATYTPFVPGSDSRLPVPISIIPRIMMLSQLSRS